MLTTNTIWNLKCRINKSNCIFDRWDKPALYIRKSISCWNYFKIYRFATFWLVTIVGTMHPSQKAIFYCSFNTHNDVLMQNSGWKLKHSLSYVSFVNKVGNLRGPQTSEVGNLGGCFLQHVTTYRFSCNSLIVSD